MARQHVTRHALNAGEVSRYGLYRTDLERMRLAAERQENLLPSVLGPAIYRPGTAYLGATKSNASSILLPFVYSVTEKALLELSASVMRVWVDGALVTRPAVSTTVNGGGFDGVGNWVDHDESGAASTISGGFLTLVGTGYSYAIRRNEVTVASGDQNVEHALRIVVTKGPVELLVGSSSGEEQYVGPTTLETGTHSIAFTPTANFHIEIRSATTYPVVVDQCSVEAAGVMELPTPWASIAALQCLRYDQSADVIFCASDGIMPQRIERRSQRSWSIVQYKSSTGPLRLPNATQVSLTPSDTTGQITLTASKRLFKPDHVNGLFAITHNGQKQTATLTGENQFNQPIRISGLAAGANSPRAITFQITGTFSGRIRIQRSFGEPGAWLDYGTSYTSAVGPVTINDGLDNQIVYYRIGFKTGEYTSGSATVTMTNHGGSQRGICRVTSFTNATTVTADVLKQFSNTTSSTDWEESEWSDYRGWPSAVCLHDGRLWWGWRDKVYGSVSDDYHSFDLTVEGDAGPIQRSVATGAFEGIYWMLSLQRLLAGTASQEISIRSSSFDEPLSPTAFTARRASTRGAMNRHAVDVDSNGIFVQRGGKRVYALTFSGEAQDYVSDDLTRLKPEMCAAGVLDIAVQRQPDTRIWFVLNNGNVAVLTYEPDDEVVAWSLVTFSGGVESICVLPGNDEDEVYFVIRRTVNSSTVRYVERLAKESECAGGTLSKNVDSHIVYTGSATATISGLGHLEGRDVVVWADGAPLESSPGVPQIFTVSSGSITLPSSLTNVVAGLAIPDGVFVSSKLDHASALGAALGQRKRVDHVGVAMADVGWRGVSVGRSATETRSLPATYRGATIGANTHVLTDYDAVLQPFRGNWGADERICFTIKSPYPGRFLGVSFEITTADGIEGLGRE